ncbi:MULTISPECIES: PBP1A family penicillin-binding protein [unclassified Jeotgalibaca]|uniref:PBP1A family penicillin-binding protein n=1 Tax=unclassified Jeotgalibaca TaxID=2621505 RepID=UPI003FD19875
MPNQSQSRQQRKKVTNKSKSSKGKKKKTDLWKKVIIAILIIGFTGLLAGGGLFAYYASNAPEVNREALVDAVPSKLLDINDEVAMEVGAGAQNRELAGTEEIPELLQQAVVSIEDQRFYDHIGVDPIRILGAVVANFRDGGISQGGSTITQQLIKLSFFSTSEEDQTLERKAQEAWMALKLEREISKDEILALYINKVYMGNNVYGMATAAEYYYGKELADLTLSEAATLAGMPQAPSYYDPYLNPAETEERRNIVLMMMVDHGAISEEQRAEATAVPVTENLVDHSNDVDNSLVMDSYLQLVMEEVYEKTGLEVEMGGLTIETNLDMDAQQHLYDIVNSEDYILFPDDEVQTAVTLVDVDTGALNAVVGNRKKTNLLAINYADQNTRSVASTIKPLIDYAPAIEYNSLSTGSLIVDEEMNYPDGTPIRNYDLLYRGDLTIREALVDSRNVPAVKLLTDVVGIDNAAAFLSKLGIDSVQKDGGDEIYPSNALQGSISNIQMAAAYAAFANGGTYYKPYTVQSVTDSKGNVYEFKPDGTVAMKDSTAYMMTDMMKDVVTVSAPNALVPGVPVAGKTGTEEFSDSDLALVEATHEMNVAKDSWFVGYSPNYSVAVWMGYEEILPGNYLEFQTREITRYIFQELMSYVSQDIDNPDWVKPDSVVEATMEKFSNPVAKPGPNTPSNMQINELFVKGTEPTAISRKYGEELKAPTGLKASYNKDTNKLTISWDAYKLASGDNRTPQFDVTVGSNSQPTTATQLVVDNPAKGNIQISIRAKLGSATSPPASIQITIEEPKEPEKEESSEPESSSSSSESSEEVSSSSSEEQSSSESSETEAVTPSQESKPEESSEAPQTESEESENTDNNE